MIAAAFGSQSFAISASLALRARNGATRRYPWSRQDTALFGSTVYSLDAVAVNKLAEKVFSGGEVPFPAVAQIKGFGARMSKMLLSAFACNEIITKQRLAHR